jgi:chromate reductase
MTKLLGISGSLRKDSYNSMLLAASAKSFGSDYTLADLNLPLYDGDVETNEGIPAAVQTLHNQMAAADAIIIATPEYNGNLSGVLKNALDWVSRIDGQPMADKPTAIMSATAGRAGGVTALYSLRLCLTAFQPTIVNGPLVAVAACYAAFDDTGALKEESYQKAVDGLMAKLKVSI